MSSTCPRCDAPLDFAPGQTDLLVCPSCGSGLVPEDPCTTISFPENGPRRLGKFEFMEELGAGAFGTVYKARDTELGRVVALKIPRSNQVPRPADKERFLREAQSAARLQHPGIVALFDAGQVDGTCYLACEFIHGVTLAERQSAGRLGFREAAELVAATAEALHFAHQHGIVHRDIKPSNIMLDLEGRPHLMDFGLARRDDDDVHLTLEGQVLGTPAYMSPEQARGEGRRVDARSDVYSLGVVLYELLAGELPFRGQKRMLLMQVIQDEPRPPRRLNDRIPRDLETICLKAMAKSPGRRYASAAELAADLRRTLRGEPIQARPVGRAERLRRWCGRNPVVAGLGAALALALLGGFAGVLWKWRDAEAQRAEAEDQRNKLAIARAETVEERNAALDAQNVAVTQAGLALKAREEAVVAGDRYRRLLYASDVGLAQQYWEMGDLKRARTLLDRQRPRPDQEDLRDFSWRHFWRLCQGDEFAALDPGPSSVVVSIYGHSSHIVALAPDGKTTATSAGGTIRLWDVSARRELARLHTGNVRALAFAPDSRTLIVGTVAGPVTVWDSAERKLLSTLAVPKPTTLLAMTMTADGKVLATLAADGIRLWDLATARLAVTIPNSRKTTLIALALSPDGKTVVTGDNDRKVCLWDVATRKLLAVLPGHTAFVTTLAFSPDGKRLASSGQDRTILFWDVAARRETFRLAAHRAAVCTIAFSPDGRLLASGSVDRTIKLWDAEMHQQIGTLRTPAGFADGLSFAADGTTLASTARDGSVRLWRVLRDVDRTVFARHAGWVHHLNFAPDGKTLVSTDTHEGKAVLWDVASGNLKQVLAGKGWIWFAAYGADGKALATGSNGAVRLWDVGTSTRSEPTKEWPAVTAGGPHNWALAPDARKVAAWQTNGPLEVWDFEEGRVHMSLKGVSRATFSADGATLAAGGRLGKIRLWDIATKKQTAVLDGHEEAAIVALCYSPAGKLLASAGADRTVRLWDVGTKRQSAVLGEHTTTMHWPNLAFSPDGLTVASTSDDGTITLWHTLVGQEVARLKGHQGPVVGIAFSPDGTILASSGADGTVRFWRGTSLADADSPTAPRPVDRALTLHTTGAAQATMVFADDHYRIDVVAVGNANWHVQVRRPEDLREGETYTLRFRARSDSLQEVNVVALSGAPKFAPLGLNQPVPLGADWRHYEFTFRAAGVTGASNLN